ncbi:histidine kinase, partial [Paenibacillus sepulcri]|nr:histidine kinase [Paenibacillus sepulcri]
MQYDYRAHSFSLSGIYPALFQQDWIQTETEDAAEREIIITRGLNDITGWQIVWIMNKSDLLKPLDYSVRLSWWLALASLLLSTALSFFISSYISRPIRRIAASINEVSSGNLNAEVRLNRQDEIGFLAMHFNKMTHKIGDLIDELKETEEQKKQSDFKALHMQIKPHFLYNTLNTISMMGRQGKSEQMDRMISALTNQLHYTLDASPAPVSLREELNAARNYVQLMKSRYPGKFEFDMDIDPLSLDRQLPKFILQPLVENAIFHGLVPSKNEGLLFISTALEDHYWELLIEDDGVGMNEQSLNELKARIHYRGREDQTGEHIGLTNVHERLRLMFGVEYRIEISSEAHRGSRITIRLPIGPSQHT